MFVVVQMLDLTNVHLALISCPKPPTTYAEMFERSGSHLASKFGLGFPNKFFMPWVIKEPNRQRKCKTCPSLFKLPELEA
jgi:hypothetical protein